MHNVSLGNSVPMLRDGQQLLPLRDGASAGQEVAEPAPPSGLVLPLPAVPWKLLVPSLSCLKSILSRRESPGGCSHSPEAFGSFPWI